MIVKATARQVRISPRKTNLVAALVRGRSAKDAKVILEHTPKRAAKAIQKVLSSAVANAETNHKLSTDALQIQSIEVSPGSTLKRFHFASRGRVHPIRHRSSHITVIISDNANKQRKTGK
jgi:large subunit ribosomal protein L22